MPRPGPNVTSDADTQPGSDSLFPTGFSGGGALVRSGSVGTGEIADGSVASADLNLASVATALAARGEFTGTYAGQKQATAAAILTRMSRADGEKTALYAGTAPVWTTATTSQIAGGIQRYPRRLVPANGNAASSTAVAINDDPNYRYTCTSAMAYGTVFPDYNSVRPPLLTGGGGQAAYWAPRISFYYDGQTFEWVGKAYAATESMRLRIDGKLVSFEVATVGSGLSAGTGYYFKCDPGSQAMRLIEIDNMSTPSFGGIIVEPTASISRGPAPSLRVSAMTDSIGGGSGGYTRISSWVGVVNELLGSDVATWNAGIGGTGYLTATIGTNDFITRLPDLVAADPDVLFVQGGQNDGSFTSAQIQTAASAFLTAAIAALPRALIFVLGTYSANTPSAKKMTDDAALRAAATAAGCGFISLVDPTDATVTGSGVPAYTSGVNYSPGDEVIDVNGIPRVCITGHVATGTIDATKWRPTAIFFGSGKVGTTTGDGNSDVMIQSDGIHPTARGCQALGRHVYYGMRKQLRTMATTKGA